MAKLESCFHYIASQVKYDIINKIISTQMDGTSCDWFDDDKKEMNDIKREALHVNLISHIHIQHLFLFIIKLKYLCIDAYNYPLEWVSGSGWVSMLYFLSGFRIGKGHQDPMCDVYC